MVLWSQWQWYCVIDDNYDDGYDVFPILVGCSQIEIKPF